MAEIPLQLAEQLKKMLLLATRNELLKGFRNGRLLGPFAAYRMSMLY
jgi:hypothetical protein